MSAHTSNRAAVRQEADHIRARPLLAAISAAIVLGCLGVLWVGIQLRGMDDLYRPAGERGPAGQVVTGPTSIGGISQTLIGVDSSFAKLRAQQLQVLDSFEWIDQRRGIARIPVDSAMQIVISRSQR